MTVYWRRRCISFFVIIWLAVFFYESTRMFYLEPWLKRSLPKVKMLYPPAGWIMFYQIGPQFSYAQVYGVMQGRLHPIDPHQILSTRSIGYDNVQRNALISVLDGHMKPAFCGLLKRKFPYMENFIVSHVVLDDVTKKDGQFDETVVYQCAQ